LVDVVPETNLVSENLEGKMGSRHVIIASLAILAGACSIQPLPQDVTGVSTVQIVSRVRCEIRDAIRGVVVRALRRRAEEFQFPSYLELATKLENEPLLWAKFRSPLKASVLGLEPDALKVFERYNHAAIAYDFQFDITEKNENSAGLGFLRTSIIPKRTISFDAGGSAILQRRNERHFRIADSFENLVTLVDEQYCTGIAGAPEDRKRANIMYPITGSLGLRDLIGTFLTLNQS